MIWFKDKFKRYWCRPLDTLCIECGQPCSGGNCDHKRIPETELTLLGGSGAQPRGVEHKKKIVWVETP